MASEAVAQEQRARIRIVIADDHRLVLSGLRAALATAALTLLPWPAALLEVAAVGLLFVAVYAAGIALLGVRDETRELAARARDRLMRRGSTW